MRAGWRRPWHTERENLGILSRHLADLRGHSRRRGVPFGHIALRVAARPRFVRGRLFRSALHPAVARRMVQRRRRGARAAGDADHGRTRSPSWSDQGNEARLRNYLAKMTADERLLGRARVPARRHDDRENRAGAVGDLVRGGRRRRNHSPRASCSCLRARCEVSRFDFDSARPTPYRVVMLSDLSFVDRRQRTARDFVLVFVGISILLLALLGGAGGVARAAPLGQRADRGHPRQAISRRRPIAALHAADSFPGAAGPGGSRRRSSASRSIFARIGRRRRSGRWCGTICIPRR